MDEEQIIKFVKETAIEAGSFYPTIFVKGSKDKVAVGLKDIGDTSDVKVRRMLNAGTFTAFKHHVGELEKLVFVSEAWMGYANEKGEYIRPSRDPKRIETLIINSLDTATKVETMTCFEMVRDPKGKLIDLKLLSQPEGSTVEGILLPAFQKGYQMISPVTN